MRVSATEIAAFAAGGDVNAPVSINVRLNPEIERAASTTADPPFKLLPKKIPGRSELIRELVDAGSPQKATYPRTLSRTSGHWLLHGLGGVGKSTIALDVGRRLRARGTKVFWIDASDRSSVTGAMWTAARTLANNRASLPDSVTDPGAVDAVWSVLNSSDANWALIYDNADDPSLLAAHGYPLAAGNGWLRGSSRGFTMVTSRFEAGEETWGLDFARRRVRPLLPKDGGKMVLGLLGTKPSRDEGLRLEVEALSERLGGLPLALRAASRYIAVTAGGRITGQTFASYRRALDRHLPALLDEKNGWSEQLTNRERVTATWEITLNYLAEQGVPEARPLLQIISTYGRAPVPLALADATIRRLISPPAASGELTGSGASSDFSGTSAPPRLVERGVLSALQTLSLIDITRGEGADCGTEWAQQLNMHPLVGEVLAGSQDAADRERTRRVSAAALVDVCSQVSDDMKGPDWQRLRALRQSLVSVSRHLEVEPLPDSSIAREFVMELGRLHRDLLASDAYESEKSTLECFHAVALKVLGRSSRVTRRMGLRLASIRWKLGQREEAMSQIEQSLGRLGRIVHRDYVRRLGPPGVMGMRWGMFVDSDDPNYAKQKRWLEDTLLSMPILGRSEKFLETRAVLASILEKMGEVDFALAQYEILLMSSKAHHPESSMIPTLQWSIARLREQGGDSDLAESEYRSILAHRFGNPLTDDSDSSDEDQLRRDLSVLSDSDKEDHESIRVRRSLVGLLMKRRDYSAAEPEIERLLSAQALVLGNDSEDALKTRHDLALAYYALGRNRDAIGQHRAIIRQRQMKFGEDSIESLLAHHKFGLLLQAIGHLDDAEREFRLLVKAGHIGTPEQSIAAVHNEGHLAEIEAERAAGGARPSADARKRRQKKTMVHQTTRRGRSR